MPNDPQLYARSFSDVYDDWYGDLDDPAHLLDAFVARCPVGATIVELGSGTGRLAQPLFEAGYQVIAIDASLAMLQLAEPGPNRLAADMAMLPLAARCADAVLVAYNTLFNLADRTLQQACFHEAGRVLRPGGTLAVEGFLAAAGTDSPFGVSTRPHPTDASARLALISGPDPHDPGVLVGSHVELGATITCRPWRLTYQSPAQLDACAEHAGLRLVDRHSDWVGSPFDDHGPRHVSWYERIRSAIPWQLCQV